MEKQTRFRRITKILLFLVILLIIIVSFIFFYRTPVTEKIDNFVYELPYEKGERFRIVQGYGGIFSHTNIAALDFGMPVGTPVCAARGGIIYSYQDGYDQGGFFPAYKNKANYILIKHEDGSFGCYWHLRKNGVLVKSGTVSKGQQIGFSGATGQVFRPHLHFSVKRILNYQKDAFLKTKFKTTEGDIFLEMGKSYEK